MMENKKSFKEIAYLREFQHTDQCQLSFNLKQDLKEIGVIDEEIHSVRQITDTVESLLSHTVNKIVNLIKTKFSKEENLPDIEISLKNKKKLVSSQRILKDLIHSSPKHLFFHIFQQDFPVVINSPLIKDIKLPVVLYANFTVQPRKFNTLYTDRDKSTFLWFKSSNKENWEKIGDTFQYNITDKDVGNFLKFSCIPCSKDGIFGPEVEVESELKVEKMGEIPKCPFQDRHSFTCNQQKGDSFRIVSYNTLSSRYSETNVQFPYCPPKALSIFYRRQLLAKELLGYNADIICLQELDINTFTGYFKGMFKAKGFMTFFHKKGNRISEGLACFFSSSRYKLISCGQVVMSQEIQNNKLYSHLWNLIKSNKEIRNYFLKQATSVQFTILKERSTKKVIIVANTHLFYHPDANHIRLIQINIITTLVSSLRKQFPNVTVIVCGDFNCTPTSSVYSFMINGKLGKHDEVFMKIEKTAKLYHTFKFTSACGLPKYTNYTTDFKDCLDYIFVEKDKIQIDQIVPFPTEEELSQYEGLPNEVYPSDHLALIVDLKYLK